VDGHGSDRVWSVARRVSPDIDIISSTYHKHISILSSKKNRSLSHFQLSWHTLDIRQSVKRLENDKVKEPSVVGLQWRKFSESLGPNSFELQLTSRFGLLVCYHSDCLAFHYLHCALACRIHTMSWWCPSNILPTIITRPAASTHVFGPLTTTVLTTILTIRFFFTAMFHYSDLSFRTLVTVNLLQSHCTRGLQYPNQTNRRLIG